MKLTVLCTSYTDNGKELELQDEWNFTIKTKFGSELRTLLKGWNIEYNHPIQSKNTITKVICGTMEDGKIIHIRIVRF